ncbi:MAG: hypothetical protein HC877_20530 [Thioploca sp.]|nr:hypothetical protein [Thioploca sp.]
MRSIRQPFDEFLAEQQAANPFHTTIQQAETAEQRYLRGGGAQALDEAINAWEQVLQHPDFMDTDENFQLALIDGSAEMYLRRYWTRAKLSDLATAISRWEMAVVKTPPDSPDLSRLLSNLGTGLRCRYARLGELSDLQAGIEAYQQAVAKTPPDSPDLPVYLNNLGSGLKNRYLRLGDLNDLQAR